jgi:hypothetical protein
MTTAPNKSGFIPHAGVLGSCYCIYRALVGSPVHRIVDGQKVRYYVLPLSSKEIKEKMFVPVIPKKNLSFSMVFNSLRKAPQRSPIACVALSISVIWEIKKIGNF